MSDSPILIDDPDAPASEQERAAADQLRASLEDPRCKNEGAELVRALSSAWSPRDLPAEDHAALVQRALRRRRSSPRSARVIRMSFAVGAAAIAAAVLLVLGDDRREGAPSSPTATPLVRSRSTQPLFPQRFAPSGGETERVDRIAVARAADLRDNEFARWGVR